MAALPGLAMDANRARERASFVMSTSSCLFKRFLFRFAEGFFLIRLLQDEEGLLFHALVGDETLAIEVVLETRIDAAGRAEVHQKPWAGAAKLRDFVQHRDLMMVDLGLILLGPERRVGVARWRVITGLCVTAPLGHNERFVLADIPCSRVRTFCVLLVPADVFVRTDYVQGFTKRVVNN